MGRLHGMFDHGQQLGMEGVQVDLVPQPHREPLQGTGRVIAAPVEAPVDKVLDAAAQRLEQRGHQERGGGHGEGESPSWGLSAWPRTTTAAA